MRDMPIYVYSGWTILAIQPIRTTFRKVLRTRLVLRIERAKRPIDLCIHMMAQEVLTKLI